MFIIKNIFSSYSYISGLGFEGDGPSIPSPEQTKEIKNRGGESSEKPDAKKLGEKARQLSDSLGDEIDKTGPRVEELRGGVREGKDLSYGDSVPEMGNLDLHTGDNLEFGRPDSLGNEIEKPDELSMGERVLNEEEIELVKKFQSGEIDASHPEIAKLAEELGMEEVLRTAGIDGLELGEIPDEITESTPEMLEGSKTEITNEQRRIQEEISSFPTGSPERIAGERRLGLLEGFIKSIDHALNSQNNGVPFTGVDVVGDRNVISNGMKHLGIHENTGQADKFLMGMARSARKTPWCAGFVSYVLKESGYNITPTLSSKAFINETGKGHVAFYAGNNQMLGGNQSDQVSLAPIRKPVVGWIMPEDLEARKEPKKGGKPPIGAIIVFDRGSADRNMR